MPAQGHPEADEAPAHALNGGSAGLRRPPCCRPCPSAAILRQGCRRGRIASTGWRGAGRSPGTQTNRRAREAGSCGCGVMSIVPCPIGGRPAFPATFRRRGHLHASGEPFRCQPDPRRVTMSARHRTPGALVNPRDLTGCAASQAWVPERWSPAVSERVAHAGTACVDEHGHRAPAAPARRVGRLRRRSARQHRPRPAARRGRPPLRGGARRPLLRGARTPRRGRPPGPGGRGLRPAWSAVQRSARTTAAPAAGHS